MRAITIRDPWATAVMFLGKDRENRGRREPWHTIEIGEQLAVHVAKTWDAHDLPEVTRLSSAQGPARTSIGEAGQHLGTVLGLAVFGGMHHATKCLGQCSPWAQPDQWHLSLIEPRPCFEPVGPVRGALGLWTLRADVALEVERQTS